MNEPNENMRAVQEFLDRAEHRGGGVRSVEWEDGTRETFAANGSKTIEFSGARQPAEFVPALDGKYSVDAMNDEFALVLVGKDTSIYWNRPEFQEDRWLSVASFHNMAMNTQTFVGKGKGKAKPVSFAQRWLEDPGRRTHNGLEFFPNPDGANSTSGYLNLWKGFSVMPSREGDCSVFLDHMKVNICEGDPELFRWLFGWFAQIVQEPRKRQGTAVVMRGEHGIGKSIVGETFGSLFHRHFVQVEDARYVTGQFNSHQASCLLMQCDEAVWAGDKAAEGRLKGLVTSPVNMVERKGVDAVEVRSYLRMMFTSNNDWVVPVGKGERRFAVFDVSPRCALNLEYHADMRHQLDNGGRERLLHDLLHFDISEIDLRTIPTTTALLEQKIHTFDPVESWWYERLQSGEPTRRHGLWPEFCSTDALVDDYMANAERVGINRRASATQFGMKFNKLLPGAKKVRRFMSAEGDASMQRVWGYELPTLASAREAFETICRQDIRWDSDG